MYGYYLSKVLSSRKRQRGRLRSSQVGVMHKMRRLMAVVGNCGGTKDGQ